MDTDKLYDDVWNKWGAQLQVDILIEEMAELTHALLKARRSGVVLSYDVCAEFADVQICMEQHRRKMEMVGMYDIVEKVKQTKLDRLEKRLHDT